MKNAEERSRRLRSLFDQFVAKWAPAVMAEKSKGASIFRTTATARLSENGCSRAATDALGRWQIGTMAIHYSSKEKKQRNLDGPHTLASILSAATIFWQDLPIRMLTCPDLPVFKLPVVRDIMKTDLVTEQGIDPVL